MEEVRRCLVLHLGHLAATATAPPAPPPPEGHLCRLLTLVEAAIKEQDQTRQGAILALLAQLQADLRRSGLPEDLGPRLQDLLWPLLEGKTSSAQASARALLAAL